MLPLCYTLASGYLLQPQPPPRVAASARRAPVMVAAASETEVPIERTAPSPELEPREVISSVMAALHRTNWDAPEPYYGFGIALNFLAPTHMAKLNGAKPAGYARFLRQPHKVQQTTWNEYRFEGDVITIDSGRGLEAFQMCSTRAVPTDEWTSVRWKLVKVSTDFLAVIEGRELGEQSDESQWMVEACFSSEPDQSGDSEFQVRKADGADSFVEQLRELHGEEARVGRGARPHARPP